MMEAEIAKLKSVESHLRSTILAIVKRRRSQGEPLTWRLMFEIEDEATSLLRHQGELDEDYIEMLAGRSTPVHQRPDEPVCLTDLNAMRVALWMIQEAYYHWH
jgi:plasmid replication initiation protein